MPGAAEPALTPVSVVKLDRSRRNYQEPDAELGERPRGQRLDSQGRPASAIGRDAQRLLPDRRSALAVIAALLGIASSAIGADPCDPSLIQLPNDPNGYRLRGDRCEGIYLEPLAGSASLLIASFTEVYSEFDAHVDPTLPLEWTLLDVARPTQLRAYGLRLRQYYRMDAERPAGARAYAWPTTILGNLNLSQRLLGAVAWQEAEVDSQGRRVHLPLRVGSDGRRGNPGVYALVLLAGVELTEVFLTLSRLDENGSARQVYLRKQPLGYGYYPAHQGIPVPLSGLNERGLHKLEVAATQRDLGSATTEFWFYHPGG
jgi:hypothetical protein